LIVRNIEAALAADDADLANSFVELARKKDIAVSDDAPRRRACCAGRWSPYRSRRWRSRVQAASVGQSPYHLHDMRKKI